MRTNACEQLVTDRSWRHKPSVYVREQVGTNPRRRNMPLPKRAGPMHSAVRNEVALTVVMYNLQKQYGVQTKSTHKAGPNRTVRMYNLYKKTRDPNKKYRQDRVEACAHIPEHTTARTHMHKAGPKHSAVRNEVAMTVLMYNLEKQARS